MAKENILVWFRQDLRLRDNPALDYALEHGKILPIFIHDKLHADKWEIGAASKWWLHQSLTSLNSSLNDNIHFFAGDPLTLIPQILQHTNIKTIVWNRCYEPWQIQRDKQLKAALNEQDICVRSFNGSLLWEPWTIATKTGTPYKVFTPYYRKGCLHRDSPRRPTPRPKRIQYADCKNLSSKVTRLRSSLDDLNLMPEKHWYSQIAQSWTPGEGGASQNLSAFLNGVISHYKEDRNIPKVRGSSHLSPHLHFGELSPNQVWYAALDSMPHNTENENLDTFLSELGWREFSYYLLYHWPSLPEQNFQEKFNKVKWRRNKKDLRAWEKGQTGIPIIDAGMRQLWQTGYMHNRVRMLVGSFLVKNLLIHWHHGEAWFWDCLVDADLASNSASWQWVAGTGADAAPYFRIFNPVTQGEKFDKEGEYVRRYCPELAKLPNKYIHRPWEATDDILNSAGITLGKHYPKPLVDLKQSRQRALEAFEIVKS